MTNNSAQTEPATEAKEPRGARRKRETRKRLLKAAMSLMAERGMEGVAINEITEAADVGLGSFYNHFGSKEAIYAALVDEVFETFGEALSHISDTIDDPAEVITASIRYTLLQAKKNPQWGRFLLIAGFSSQVLGRGLGRHLLRDLNTGFENGRFSGNDPLATFLVIGGTVLASISAELNITTPGTEGHSSAVEQQLETEHLAERVAAALLLQLGIDPKEASEIANRPLPPVELPVTGF